MDILQVEQPEFIDNVEEKGKSIITKESEAFLGKTEEIKDLSNDLYSKINDILDTMDEKEETIRDQKIDDFIEENQLLFDIDWNNIIENKKNTMKYGTKMLEKYLRLKCIKEYIITKRNLMNHISYVKDPKSKVGKTEERMANIVFNYRFSENKKIKKLNKVLERYLKRTNEYKEAKEETFKLSEILDKIEIKEDKRLEFLDEFKIRIEEAFTELIGDLNEFNNETND